MALALYKDADTFLYQQVINLIRQMQANGTLKAGEKLPSLRNLAGKLGVSVPTIKQAYVELEHQGLIYAREKSGYFLRITENQAKAPKKTSLACQPVSVTRQQMIEQVCTGIHQLGNLPLGVASPVAAFPASKALQRTMRRVTSVAGDQILQYGPPQGFEPLRQQLAMSYLDHGIKVDPDELIITNGAQEAISLALKTVAKPDDVIAVESPCYFGILELIESLGMLALEIPLCAKSSLNIEDIRKSTSAHPVKACILSSSISNPLGCLLTEHKKQEIVAYLEANGIALIEDDVYGDLYFGTSRGIPAQAYSRNNKVLTVSSFSKTVAPSYRVGWLFAPGFSETTGRLKRALSSSASLLNQWTLAEFLRSGEYARYIRQLRQVLQTNRDRMISLIAKYFADQVRISEPQGGTVLWLEFDRHVDCDRLFQQALAHRISIAPGSLFSPSNRYRHCMRVSYGLPWSGQIEQGVRTLASLVEHQ